MRHRSLLFCLGVLGITMFLVGCSSQSATETPQPVVNQSEQVEVTQEQSLAPETMIFEGKTYQLLDPSQPVPDGMPTMKFNGRTYKLVETPAPAVAAAPAPAPKAAAPKKPAAPAPANPTPPPAPVAPAPQVVEQPPAPAAPQPVSITLASGTPINVVTSSEISTNNGQVGDTFEAVLDENIINGDRVIARRGAVVRGVISEADPGGRVKGVATMSLQLTSITLAEGGQASVKTNNFEVTANTSVKKDATKVGIGAGIGAAIGAIAGGGKGAAIGAGVGGAAGAGTALATRGDPAVVAPETIITFNLTAPLTVTLQQESGNRRGRR